MGKILNGKQFVRFDHVSKRQLAKAVNEQGELIDRLREDVKRMAAVLISVAMEPEAFKYADGRVTVDRSALEKATNGMQIHMTYEADVVVLTAIPAALAPAVVTPQIELQ